jgi:hypothetical protein
MPGDPAGDGSTSQPAPLESTASDQPTWAWPDADQAPTKSTAGRRTGLVAVIVAVAFALVVGGGVAIYALDPFHLFHSGPQAAVALPSDALG